MSKDADVRAIFEMLKKITKNTVDGTKPSDVLFGTVISEKPLRIDVDQRFILEENQLILTNAVRDYDIKLTTKGDDGEAICCTAVADAHYTGSATLTSGSPNPPDFATHTHAYSGDKWFKVNLALKTGEKVILLRCAGAQRYVILDRVEAPKKGAM